MVCDPVSNTNERHVMISKIGHYLQNTINKQKTFREKKIIEE